MFVAVYEGIDTKILEKGSCTLHDSRVLVDAQGNSWWSPVDNTPPDWLPSANAWLNDPNYGVDAFLDGILLSWLRCVQSGKVLIMLESAVDVEFEIFLNFVLTRD